jgi:hypothetical protein
MIHKPLLQAFATLVALLVVLVLAMILGACSPSPSVNADGAEDIVKLIRSGGLRYAQDPSTGHCFAVAWITDGIAQSRIGGAVITWVPCS